MKPMETELIKKSPVIQYSRSKPKAGNKLTISDRGIGYFASIP